jgi:multiple sugar transport system substrate-binding protein
MKRFSAGLAVTVVAALALTACGGGTQTPPTTTTGSGSPTEATTPAEATTGATGREPLEAQTIRMWTFLDPTAQGGRQSALKEIIEGFEADNPGVKVSVEPQQWDLLASKFFAASQAGNAPDITWTDVPNLSQALSIGAYEPFENLFLKDWSAEDLADVDGTSFQNGATDDAHYQFTLSQNFFGIIYRKDLFAAAGIEEPKTWDDFVAAAQTLTGKDETTGIQRYGFGFGLALDKADPNIATAALLDQQGTLFNDDGTAKWADDAGKKAWQLELDMIQKYQVTPPSVLTNTVEDVYNDFLAGKYAMINGAVARVAALQASATFGAENVGFMQYPSFSGAEPSPSFVSGWAVGVWSGSQHKEAAGRFVEALVSPSADALWVGKGGQVPMRKSTLESQSAFFAEGRNAYLTTAANGIANQGWTQPTEFPGTGWIPDANQVMQDVLANGKSLDDALTAAEKAFNDRNAG